MALFLAWNFADLVEPHLGGLLAKPPVSTWAARTIIFILVLLLGMGVAAVLGYFVRLSLFSGTDRFLGFFFGLLRGVVLVGVFVHTRPARAPGTRELVEEVSLMPYGESVAIGLRAIVGEQIAKHAGRSVGCTTGRELGGSSMCGIVGIVGTGPSISGSMTR